MQPKVTVYIPTHNRKKLLLRAVNSVLNQTYKNIEIIVSDDGSSDGTQAALHHLILDKKIRYVRTEIPKGACHTRNLAIKHAEGTYITGLDDDDYFTLDRIKNFVDNLSPDYQVYSSSYTIKEQFTSIDQCHFIGEITANDILESNKIGNQVFTKTDHLRSVGGFDENLPAWQDYDLWIRLIKKYGACKKLEESTYIVDKSHLHERISTNLIKVDQAYNLFISKHPEYSQRRYQEFLRLSKLRYEQITIMDVLSFIPSKHVIEAARQYKQKHYPSLNLRRQINHLTLGIFFKNA
jgi:glycosyltransferase involved in cell wall biosynthesis